MPKLTRPGDAGALVLAAGVISGGVCWLAYRLPPASTSDFELIWVGARALLSGADPYAVVPTTGTHYPLYYPLTAIVVGLPFAALPFDWARVLWAVLSGAAFAWAALRYGRGLPAALLSANFLNAVIQGQWSPLLVAAAVVPSLSWLLAAKPSVGAALFAAFPSRRAVIGGLAAGRGRLCRVPGLAGALGRFLSGRGTHLAHRKPRRLHSPPRPAPLEASRGTAARCAGLHSPDHRAVRHAATVSHSQDAVAGIWVGRLELRRRVRPGGGRSAASRHDARVHARGSLAVHFLCLYLPALIMVLLPRAAEGSGWHRACRGAGSGDVVQPDGPAHQRDGAVALEPGEVVVPRAIE